MINGGVFEHIKPLPPIPDIQHYLTFFDIILHFSTSHNIFQHLSPLFSTLFNTIYHFLHYSAFVNILTIFNIIRQYIQHYLRFSWYFLNIFQHYSTSLDIFDILDIIQHYSTLFDIFQYHSAFVNILSIFDIITHVFDIIFQHFSSFFR